MIIKVEVVSPFQENCYIIGDEQSKKGAIIDPGDEADRILDVARQTGLDFQFILNTHAHLDHVGAVLEVKTELSIPFYLHKEDQFLLDTLPQQAAMFGLRIDEPPAVDFYYGPNAEIKLGGLTFKIFHTPGHSPGSICLYEASESVVFGGDVLFQGSIGRIDLPGGDFETLINSIRTSLFVLPDETTIYPGHGPSTTIGHEKRFNPFLNGSSGFYA